MGIMGVLAELHHEPELKLNLKFEIEVLCKSLQLEAHVSLLFKYSRLFTVWSYLVAVSFPLLVVYL